MQWTRQQIQRFFFISLSLLLLLRYYEGLWFIQLQRPVLTYISADNVYWLLHILRLPQTWVADPFLPWLAEPLLLSISVLKIIRPNWMIPNYVFAPLFTLYFVTFNSIQTHHAHDLLGFFFLGWALIFSSKSYFPFIWNALRFYFCFVMFSAALWKIGRGSLFELEQMSRILQHQHLYLLSYQPEALFSRMIIWLIEHPFWSWMLLLVATLLELFFAIGFFTKKYDRYLLLALLLFVAGDYVLMNLSFIAFLIFGMLFFPLRSTTSNQLI